MMKGSAVMYHACCQASQMKNQNKNNQRYKSLGTNIMLAAVRIF